MPVIERTTPVLQQHKVLRRLLRKAAYTKFGLQYRFIDILRSNQLEEAYRKSVPVHTYNSIYQNWWIRTLEGEENVCWPGHTRYFALSSGTSEAASKRIPLTADMIRAIKRGSIKQIISSRNYDLPAEVYEKKILMVGGSTALNRRGDYFEGDLSGISAKKIPFWFHVFYKPGRRIAKEKNWDTKLNQIARKAKEWDVSIIVGVPAWIQILLERIIRYYDVETIHDVWPNLQVYVHSGVSFEPYREGFRKLLSHPLTTMDSYLSSEGYIAFADRPECKGMRLLLNNGIYFEFIPFTDENFNADGEVLDGAKFLHLGEVEAGKPYALLLSTCAGAWRYLIGDVVRFTDTERGEIEIAGRTKHYLNLTGEHLSVDNMNQAVNEVSRQMHLDIREFTVAGIPYEGLFAHEWWIGCDEAVDTELLRKVLDETLRKLNDDYAIERDSALKELFVHVIPNQNFLEWMRHKGKLGGQHKFPRVLKGEPLTEWKRFLEQRHAEGK